MLGIRLRECRKSCKLTQEEVAQILRNKYNQRTDRVMISKWETGFQTPGTYSLSCLSKIYGVSMDYLSGKSDMRTSAHENLHAPALTDDFVTFPVIGEMAAGYEHIAIEDWSGDTIDIPKKYLKGRNPTDYIVLKVTGDSMYPQFLDGDFVLVLKQDTLDRSGQIGAVIYNDECATIKKVEYVMGEDWMKLIPINPEFMEKTIFGEDLEHCRVIGIPKLLIREF